MEGNNLNHHKRYEYCRTRLQYRQGKELSAVKVYTVANESIHLLIFGVPKINLQNEIKKSLQKYGPIKSIVKITDEIVKNSTDTDFKLEQFTDVFHASFEKLQHARRAKKFLDANNFYGGILHISYGPEYENLNELREKLKQRKMEVKFRIKLHKKNMEKQQHTNENQTQYKRQKLT